MYRNTSKNSVHHYFSKNSMGLFKQNIYSSGMEQEKLMLNSIRKSLLALKSLNNDYYNHKISVRDFRSSKRLINKS